MKLHACMVVFIGTFPVVALMVGNAIARLTNDLPECMTNTTLATDEGVGGNDTGDPCALSDCVAVRVEIAVTVSLLVGILMVRVEGRNYSRHMYIILEYTFPCAYRVTGKLL